MTSYLTAKRQLEDGELRRAYWVCGSERSLVEDIVDTVRVRVDPSEFDHVTLMAGRVKDREVWAHVNQYPLNASRRRLVVVRDADRIRDWRPLDAWLDSRQIPMNHVVFVSNDRGGSKDASHVDRISKTGRFVRCAPLTEREAVAYVEALGDIERGTVKRLLARVGWDLVAARDAMQKLTFFKGAITDEVLEVLTVPAPSESFVSSLMAQRKREALMAAENLEDEEAISRVLGELNWRLEAANRIKKHMAREARKGEIVSATRMKTFQVEELMKVAPYYDVDKVRRDTAVLAAADDALREGSTVGVLEMVTALW